MATNTLYSYYQSQGQSLPSVSERAATYEKQGLGKATDYKGTAAQNTSLLNSLNPNTANTAQPKETVSPAVITSKSANKKVNEATKNIATVPVNDQKKSKTSKDYAEESEEFGDAYADRQRRFERDIRNVTNGAIKYTKDEQAQLDYIESAVKNAHAAQEVFNRQSERGTRLLSAMHGGEFAPVRSQSMIQQTIQSGLNELKNIDLEGAAKMGEARTAIRNRRFDEIIKTNDEITSLLDKRSAVIRDMRDYAFKAETDARDYELRAKQVASQLATDALQREKLGIDIAKLKFEYGSSINDSVLASNPKNISYFNAMSNASLGLPENQRDENIKRMNAYLKQGDYKSAGDLILRTTFEKLPTEKKNAAIDRSQAIGGLTAMRDLLTKYGTQTGLATGTIEDIRRKLGETGGENLAKFEQELTLALQPYRSSITGAAWGPQEDKEYKRIYPSLKNTNSLNLTLIDNLTNAFERNQGVEVGIYTGQNEYNNIFRQPKDLQQISAERPDLKPSIESLIDQGYSEDEIYQLVIDM